MELIQKNTKEQAVISWLEDGIPLVSRPYQGIAQKLHCSEQDILDIIANLKQKQDIRRFGVVVHHRKLGYCANGMVVWDVPDQQVKELGECMGRFDYVTLCYQRPRHLPDWQYNLFTMIHGRNRDDVIANTKKMAQQCQLQNIPYKILFSLRCFKQRGARYGLREVSQVKQSKVESTSLKLKAAR